MEFTANWVNRLLQAMDQELDERTKRAILSQCSEACTEPWAQKARDIRRSLPAGADAASLLEAFRKVLPGPSPDVRVEGANIYWSFAGGECPCPVGRLTKNPQICLCGIGHVKGMLEPLLGRPLEVTLQQSRLRGDDRCAFVVRMSQT